ncbi:hypothetical protein [Marivirga lumbricoides]|uniref:hypothetical protein n=1 Tax=Marivirga lumbricoides TaxID=1046115 RepID=UPI00166C6FA0
MHTCIQNKSHPIWIVIAMEKNTRQVVDFYVGSRTKRSLGMVVNIILYSDPTEIITDNLNLYRSLIPAEVHSIKPYVLTIIWRGKT